MTLKNYYNRFEPSKNYDKSLFLSGRGLQSAELNEIQEYALYKIKGIGDAIFRDGDVIQGATCIVDPDTGHTTIEAGGVYLRGSVRIVSNSEFTIPIDTVVRIGVWYQETTVTELEDPGLRDPAVGTRNYQEPGAARTKIALNWDYQAEGVTATQEGAEFYPIYAVDNGVLIQTAPPPQLDAVNSALARYDRESNGSYVVNGLKVRFLTNDNGEQVFVIDDGKAHVDGYEIELPHSLRSRFDIDPDLQAVESEPHTFQADENGEMIIGLNNRPLAEVSDVDITVEKTITMTHGSFTGAADPIPDDAVLSIIQVRQGATVYSNGEDYRLQLGAVDWSLSGAEPAPGSTYEITYQARERITPTDITETGFTITGAVEGSLVLVDYVWSMPRFDLITIDRQGTVRRIKGIAHPWRPSIPRPPSGQLALAYIEQNWFQDAKPLVMNNAIHAIPMSDIERMRAAINDLYDLLAQEKLRNDANAQEPSAKKGVFVDPFFDDDMRDQGLEQTAAIVDQELTLPIAAEVADIGKASSAWTLPYELETILEQPLQTMDMKINPYQAFDPIPAKTEIILNVDRWTEVETSWSSPVTRRFSIFSSPITRQVVSGWGWASRTQSTTTRNVLLRTQVDESNELLNSNTREASFMRPITQRFTVRGFAPGETLRMVFDGIDIEPEAQG